MRIVRKGLKGLKYFKSQYPLFAELLKNVKLVKDSSSYTNNDTIHYADDEFLVHELGHYIGNNDSIHNLYLPFAMLSNEYDFQPGKWFADIKWLQRDPSIRLGDYYDKSEVSNRVRAAKFRSLGLKYTADFFKNLRSNENLYGDNMRDLLHMYDDENLVKLFAIE